MADQHECIHTDKFTSIQENITNLKDIHARLAQDLKDVHYKLIQELKSSGAEQQTLRHNLRNELTALSLEMQKDLREAIKEVQAQKSLLAQITRDLDIDKTNLKEHVNVIHSIQTRLILYEEKAKNMEELLKTLRLDVKIGFDEIRGRLVEKEKMSSATKATLTILVLLLSAFAGAYFKSFFP